MTSKSKKRTDEFENFETRSRTSTVGYFSVPSEPEYKVFVIGEESAEPHFYLQHNSPGGKNFYAAAIRIKDFQITRFKFGRKRRLTKSDFMQLAGFLESVNPAPILKPGTTNWQYLCFQWDNENRDFPIDSVPDLEAIKKRGDFTYDPKLKL